MIEQLCIRTSYIQRQQILLMIFLAPLMTVSIVSQQLLELSNAGEVPTISVPLRLGPGSNLFCQVLGAEAEVLEQYRVRSRVTEACHVSTRMSIFGPTEGGVGLDRYDEGLGRGNDGSSVLERLCVESTGVRHRYDSDRVLVLQQLGSINSTCDLGTSGDEGYIRNLVLVAINDISTVLYLVSVCTCKKRYWLSSERKQTGVISVPETQGPCADHFLSVGRSNVVEVREGTEEERESDRLVGRTVLTHTDGVVSSNGDESELHQSGHSERRSGIEPEDEVTRHDAVGPKSATIMYCSDADQITHGTMAPLCQAARPLAAATMACSRIPYRICRPE